MKNRFNKKALREVAKLEKKKRKEAKRLSRRSATVHLTQRTTT
jgi:hypothetical protein